MTLTGNSTTTFSLKQYFINNDIGLLVKISFVFTRIATEEHC